MKISLTELEQILETKRDLRTLKIAYGELHKERNALVAERATLLQKISDLLAGDAATLAKAQALFNRTEQVEDKMRGAIPAS